MGKKVSVGSISWFDIPVSNTEKAQAFYKGLLSWDFQTFTNESSEECNYWMITIKGAPMPIGGMYNVQKHKAVDSIVPGIYFTVENVADTLKKAKSLGAKVKTERTEIPNNGGFFAHIYDLDNNTIGIWGPK